MSRQYLGDYEDDLDYEDRFVTTRDDPDFNRQYQLENPRDGLQ